MSISLSITGEEWTVHTSDMSAVKQKKAPASITAQYPYLKQNLHRYLYRVFNLCMGRSHLCHERCKSERRARLDTRPCGVNDLSLSIYLEIDLIVSLRLTLYIYLSTSICLFIMGHSHLGHERCETKECVRLDGRPCRASGMSIIYLDLDLSVYLTLNRYI